MFRRVIDSNETATPTLRRAARGDRVPLFSDPFGRNADDGFLGRKIDPEKRDIETR